MNICIITYKYPGRHNSSEYAFVKQLVDAFAEEGHHCFVLAPFNISHYRCFSVTHEEYNCGKGKVTVYRPNFFSFSNFHIGSYKFSDYTHKCAIKRAFTMLKVKPDIIYGHFWNSAYDGYDYAKERGIPLFVATGESNIDKLFTPRSNICDFANYVSGVICVSSKNREESIRLGLTTIDKCGVFPNAVDVGLFHKRDKLACRKQLNLPKDCFIVVFVGWFIERKGVLRVADAIDKSDRDVKSIFIGKGNQQPSCKGILFKGELSHEKVPVYLGAADCFVLPTLHEGCCNAVVEAMACGLPIISSNLPFNWDVLDETNSIMVQPTNIDEIVDAIRTLYDNSDKRAALSIGALRKAENLTIKQRASAILDFINQKIKYNNRI